MADPEQRLVVQPARARGERDQRSVVMILVRYGLPAALVLAGVVCLMVVESSARLDAGALFIGAGLSVLLLNLLFRLGFSGDEDRDQEDAARDYFSEHGEWPDEAERPAGRRWRLPEGVVMPAQDRGEPAPDRRRAEPTSRRSAT